MSVPLKDEIAKKTVPALPFWPNFVLREIVIWLVLLGTVLTVSLVFAPSLGPSADLMAPAPQGVKPEWYFLFLFQTLKIFPANMGPVTGELVAVVIILIGIVAIFFVPFLDNKPETKKGRMFTYLTIFGVIYAIVFSIWSLL
jgi:cytochrome b6